MLFTAFPYAASSDDYDLSLDTEKVPGKGGLVPWGLLAAGAAAGLALWCGWAAWRKRKRDHAAPATARLGLPTPPGGLGGTGAIGKYQLGTIIGQGGMGQVYYATDTVLGRQVALKKVIGDSSGVDAQGRDAFLKEARTVAQLHHPAIIDVYDVVEADGGVYLVFELLSGKTAQQLVAESGKLSLRRASDLLKPVCDALDYAHGRQIVHRDLKPGNIMETEQGQVKLMDFGLARAPASATAGVTASAAPRTGGVFARTVEGVGTPAYMAPEAEAGVICKEGDVYSLGATLYELLTGKTPFGDIPDPADRKAGRFRPASAAAPGLTPAVDAVIARALKASPRERFGSAGEFYAALATARLS